MSTQEINDLIRTAYTNKDQGRLATYPGVPALAGFRRQDYSLVSLTERSRKTVIDPLGRPRNGRQLELSRW